MTIRSAFAAASAAILFLNPCARADTPLKAQLQSAGDAMCAAVKKHDLNALMAFYAPGFTMATRNGPTVTLPVLKRQMQQLFAQSGVIDPHITVQKASLKGAEAHATVKEHLHMVMHDPSTPKPLDVLGDNVTDEVWIKSGKRWLRKSALVVSHTMTINGQPVPNMMH